MAPITAEFTVAGEAIRGAFRFDQRIFRELSKRLPDGHYEIHVERLQASRSVQANKYYWGVVIEALSTWSGYTPSEMHELMKQKFLPKALALTDGNGEIKGEFVIGGSTRKLKVSEFHRYVEQVRQFAAECDVYTPDPGEA